MQVFGAASNVVYSYAGPLLCLSCRCAIQAHAILVFELSLQKLFKSFSVSVSALSAVLAVVSVRGLQAIGFTSS